MNCRVWLMLASLALALVPRTAGAEVIDRSAAGFTVKTVVTIAATSPERVFLALVDGISRWWNPAHTVSGDAKNIRLAAAAGGCLCETLPTSGSVTHAVINHVVQGRLLRLTGALGPLQEHAVTGTLTWQFDKAADGTTATVTYRVSGYFPGGFDNIAMPVDQVIGDQLKRLKGYVEQ